MKILFLNPPWWEGTPEGLRYGIRAGSRWPFTAQAHCHPDRFSFGGYLPAPFFMQYAASYAQRAFPGAQVVLRDSIALRESYGTCGDFLRSFLPDYMVVESATPSWDHDRRALEMMAGSDLGIKVIVTGTITTTRAAEILAVPGVVACVKGEYEKGVIKAIQGQRGVIEHELLTTAEMNAAPFPLLSPDTARNYWDACPVGHQPPQLQFWSSRGCPFKCCFCAWPATMTGNDPDGTGRRAVRFYSPEYMGAFLTESIARFGYRSLYDDSDTFNLNQKHTIAMCEVYARTGLPWSAMCRADTIDRATWQLMKDSGCFGVKIGFESGSQRVIDHIVNKRLDLKQAADTTRMLRSIGLTVHGTFTVGLPGETPGEARQTIEFIKELYASDALDTHQLSGTATIEGTPLGTLRDMGPGGHLETYDEAKIDDAFVQTGDGQRKIESIFTASATLPAGPQNEDPRPAA